MRKEDKDKDRKWERKKNTESERERERERERVRESEREIGAYWNILKYGNYGQTKKRDLHEKQAGSIQVAFFYAIEGVEESNLQLMNKKWLWTRNLQSPLHQQVCKAAKRPSLKQASNFLLYFVRTRLCIIFFLFYSLLSHPILSCTLMRSSL